jgi:putative FmdB family regulatory protein
MPTYDYKCNFCNNFFISVHSTKDRASKCPHCHSEKVEKTISLFAAKTESSLEGVMRHHEAQSKKDIERFWKDDKFAANITGADDPEHGKKLSKALNQLEQKNAAAREKIKRVKND